MYKPRPARRKWLQGGADDRRILLDQGHRVRVYVPYGKDWHAYSLRRLRENPQVARHVIRALFSRSGGR